MLVSPEELVLVTGAAGFIGSRLVNQLVELGHRNIRCLVRPSSNTDKLNRFSGGSGVTLEILKGNLLSPSDCLAAAKDAVVIYHLAAGTGTKSFADAFLNSVITTRNLLDAALSHGCLRRFVNLSSFAVYSNRDNPRPGVLDEDCPMEVHPEQRCDAYCFAKVKQDQLVMDYGIKHHIPYVLVRPGVVFGPGKRRIHGRIGLDTFGIFLHLGGANPIPLTYLDNCAEAIGLSGLKKGIDGQIFNVVDDDLPTSKQFLGMYKSEVKAFHSLYLPHFMSYLLCMMWEKYSAWSDGQLPAVYNRLTWRTSWKRTQYPNDKIKTVLGWRPQVSMRDGLREFFADCRGNATHA